MRMTGGLGLPGLGTLSRLVRLGHAGAYGGLRHRPRAPHIFFGSRYAKRHEAQTSAEPKSLVLQEGDTIKIDFPGAPNLDTTKSFAGTVKLLCK